MLSQLNNTADTKKVGKSRNIPKVYFCTCQKTNRFLNVAVLCDCTFLFTLLVVSDWNHWKWCIAYVSRSKVCFETFLTNSTIFFNAKKATNRYDMIASEKHYIFMWHKQKILSKNKAQQKIKLVLFFKNSYYTTINYNYSSL